jgi:hypothetical protein
MRKLGRILRKAMLTVMMVVVAGGTPLSMVYAETAPTTGYTYNSDTQHWDTKNWQWDAAQNKYVRRQPVVTPSPSPSVAPETDTTKVANDAPAPSSTAVAVDTNAAANTNINNNAAVTNDLDSHATTGNAGVTRNTTAGNAATGDASADTTIVNSVHSTVGVDTQGVAHFTTNIYGDVTGDITIGPNIQNATIDRNLNLSDNTNVNNNSTLTNNQTLDAKSGNATVRGNTSAGSAQSGNANTVANVLNLINTIVAANKSFVGTVNIYGNLNGDIMVSPDFIPQLLGSNAQVYGNYNLPLSTNVNDDQSIENNVKLSATSGTATVKDNTTAGTAKTGSAQTNLTILNLTGHQVDAKKSLLVFVNVLGKWVGMIVDAPGATAAALGSGVISDNVNISSANNLNNTGRIVNNLDLSSTSGNATVAGNTQAGDAVTGNATASANIANISTSEFKLTDWFGVLFINVFGTWIGSFGIDTEAGTVVPLSGNGLGTNPNAPNLRFGFIPKNSVQEHPAALAFNGAGGSGPMSPSEVAALLGGPTDGQIPGVPGMHLRPVASPREDPFSVVMMIGGFMVAGIYGAGYGLRRWRDAHTITPGAQASGLALPH